MEKIKVEDIIKVLNDLSNIEKPERNGYILFPSSEGFDVFEISEDRLVKYINAEMVYQYYKNEENEITE